MKNLYANFKASGSRVFRNVCLLMAGLFFISSSSFGQGVSFSQWANQDPGSQWVPGALIPNNSQYYEATSTLQRAVFVGIPSTAPSNLHTLKFKVLARKGNVYAYDFVTGFDQAIQDYANVTGSTTDLMHGLTKEQLVSAMSIPNPATQQMILGLYNGGNAATASAPTNYNDPKVQTVINAYDAGTYPAAPGVSIKRGVQLYGNAPISNAALAFDGFVKGGSDTYGSYTLTYESASTNLLLLMGGHLSVGATTNSSYPGLAYGTGFGASSISGGPYHFKLETFDGNSLGNQDNQIQAGSIEVFIAPCTLTDVNNTCVNEVETFFVTTNMPGPSYAWSFTSNTAGATFVQSNGSPLAVPNTPGSVSTVYVKATTSGSYTVSVTTSQTGYQNAVCSEAVTVNPNPTITPSIGDICYGTTSASLTYSGATGSPDQYSIDWNAAANLAGLTDVAYITLPVSPITISGTGSVAAGTYSGTLYVKNSTTGCSSGTAISLTINPNPTIATPAIGAICYGTTTASLTYSGVTNGANQYRIDWNVAAETAGLVDVAYTSLPASPITISGTGLIAAGTYSGTIYVKNSTTSCESAGDIVSLTINPNPTITNPAIGAICQGETSASLTYDGVTNSPDQYSIDWNAAANLAGLLDIGYTNFTFDGTAIVISGTGSLMAGSYSGTIYVKNSTTGCVSSGNIVLLVVNANPDGPTVEYLAPACDETTFSLKITGVISGAFYTVLDKNGATITGISPATSAASPYEAPNSNDITFTGIPAGSGYQVYVTSAAGCVSGSEVCPALPSSRQAAPVTKPQPTIGNNNEKTINAFPVPFSDKVTIEFTSKVAENYVINLYNMQGQLVKQLKAGDAKAGEVTRFELSGRGMAESMYLVRKVSKSGVETVKLLKKE